MNIKIFKIPKEQPEELEIRCHEETELVHEIVTFVASIQGRLTGILEGEQYEIPVSDILYVESVDNQTFIYSNSKVYGSRQKLYEIEGVLKEKWFRRVSKNLVVNLMKVKSIKPAVTITLAISVFAIFVVTHLYDYFKNLVTAKRMTTELMLFQQKYKS